MFRHDERAERLGVLRGLEVKEEERWGVSRAEWVAHNQKNKAALARTEKLLKAGGHHWFLTSGIQDLAAANPKLKAEFDRIDSEALKRAKSARASGGDIGSKLDSVGTWKEMEREKAAIKFLGADTMTDAEANAKAASLKKDRKVAKQISKDLNAKGAAARNAEDKARKTKPPGSKGWVDGYYQDRSGNRVWVEGYWR